MIKIVDKLAIVGALSLCIFGTSFNLQEPNKVEAATKKVLPDNHTIEQLEVNWLGDGSHGYTIDVGKRVGTLLIRVDKPIKENDVEWKNYSISKPSAVNLSLHTELVRSKQPYQSPITFSNFYDRYIKDNGIPNKFGKDLGVLKTGLMKFSGYDYPNIYIGMAVYIDQIFSNDGVYWFGGSSYALKEEGQVKAYFYENQDVVVEGYNRIINEGTFPLMNKVMWGKTELWKGQLGKVTIKETVTLWKRLDNGKLENVRNLNKGDEFRVYRYVDEGTGLYGVGAGMFVKRNTDKVLYETPSKRNLRLVKIMHGEE